MLMCRAIGWEILTRFTCDSLGVPIAIAPPMNPQPHAMLKSYDTVLLNGCLRPLRRHGLELFKDFSQNCTLCSPFSQASLQPHKELGHGLQRRAHPETLPSLNVGLLAHAAQVSEQQFDEEVGLLRVGHPQDGAAVARRCVVAASRKPVAHMQHLTPCMLSLSVANSIGVIHGLKQHAREILHYHQVPKQCRARSK